MGHHRADRSTRSRGLGRSGNVPLVGSGDQLSTVGVDVGLVRHRLIDLRKAIEVARGVEAVRTVHFDLRGAPIESVFGLLKVLGG